MNHEGKGGQRKHPPANRGARSTFHGRQRPGSQSPEWLAFWRQQFTLYENGEEHVPLTLEGVRAVMQAIPDDDEAAVQLS